MEGVLFIPPDRPDRNSNQICADCGRAFRPRPGAEGAEELCDNCYQAQFEPRRLRHWQKPAGRMHPVR